MNQLSIKLPFQAKLLQKQSFAAVATPIGRCEWSTLNQRSIKLFPRADYLDARAVRHLRRRWILAVLTLRAGRGWVADGAPSWLRQTTH